MIYQIIQLIVFTFAVAGCAKKNKSDDLKKLLSEISVRVAYTIGEINAESIGWHDSFQSGFMTFEHRDAVNVLLGESTKVGYKPIKGSYLLPKINTLNPPQIWLYKSKGSRDKQLYFIVEDKIIFFDLLLL